MVSSRGCCHQCGPFPHVCVFVCVDQFTIQVSKETLGGIPIWIIIISILIGILILALVIFILWKVNLCPQRPNKCQEIFLLS